jgi:hypothetical protein
VATVDNAELRTAVSEFHQYLSDRIAPLMFTDSAELLLRYPASALAVEIERWKAQQLVRAPGVPAADFLFHGVKKVAVMGELDLVPKEVLGSYLTDLSQEVLQYCPEEDRETLRRNLLNIGESMPADDGAPLSALHRQGSAPQVAQAGAQPGVSLSPEVVLAMRRLSLFLEHLHPQAPTKRRGEIASQFVTTAAVRSSTEKELEESLAPLRQLGIDTGSGNLLKAVAESLPGWGSLPTPDGGKSPRVASAQLNAMRQIVLLGEDEGEVGKRLRELVHAAIEQFNQGHLGRASTMCELALKLVADGKVQSMFVGNLRNHGHEKLDSERLKSVAERVDSRPALRKVLKFFNALQPDGLFEALDGESTRERRHGILTLLEVHGDAARAKALELLRESVQPGADMDPFFQMNLIYFLRIVPRAEEANVGYEVDLVMQACGKTSPPPMVKQAIAFLAQSEHEDAERALLAYLQVFEDMLLKPETRLYPPEEIDALLDRTCAALARYGTPRAWRALVDHGLNTETRLGSTVSRLIAAGHQDLSKQKDLLARLVAALKAELPRSLLGVKFRKNDEKRLSLVQALAGTPAPEVRELMQDIVNRYPGEKFAEAASKALAAFSKSGESTSAAGLSGDLELFGLPTVLQILGQISRTGVLSLLTTEGTLHATLAFEEGRLRAARFGNLSGDDAVYQLFVKPFPGTFAFVSRKDIESSHGPLGPPQDIVNLILEGVRRHDEWRRAAALVPEDAKLKPTGKPSTAPEGESKELSDSVWDKASLGATPAECEASSAVDSYRVRRLLSHWVEEEALAIA